MNPVTGITIYRTKGDTDPISVELKVTKNGTTNSVANTANVTLNLKLDDIVSISGNSAGNGVFNFAMTTVNTNSVDVSEFEIYVQESSSYVIASGVITYRNRLM